MWTAGYRNLDIYLLLSPKFYFKWKSSNTIGYFSLSCKIFEYRKCRIISSFPYKLHMQKYFLRDHAELKRRYPLNPVT